MFKEYVPINKLTEVQIMLFEIINKIETFVLKGQKIKKIIIDFTKDSFKEWYFLKIMQIDLISSHEYEKMKDKIIIENIINNNNDHILYKCYKCNKDLKYNEIY